MTMQDVHNRFAYAMSEWFEQNGFRSATPEHDAALERQFGIVKTGLTILKHVASSSSPMFLSGNFDEQKIAAALEPFTSECDLLGYKLNFMYNRLIAVVFSDRLDETRLIEKIPKLFDLAEPLEGFGVQYNFQGNPVEVRPMFVFFDPARYRALSPPLLAKGWKGSYWRRVYLRTLVVDIAGQSMKMAAMPKLHDVVHSALKAAHLKDEPFAETDLQSVLAAMARVPESAAVTA